MSIETISAAIVVLYVGGVILTGMVVAFGTEAFFWDGERAIETALLWPVLLLVLTVASPFLFASWLGSLWRKMTWDRDAQLSPTRKTDDLPGA